MSGIYNDIYTSFHQFVSTMVKFPEDAWVKFKKNATIKNIQKKEHLVKEGEICKSLGFFNEGYFRFYYFNKNADEITLNFHFAPGFITSYTSFISGHPSRIFVQAMENTQILSINHTALYQLMDLHPQLMKLGKFMADKIAIDAEEHLFNLLNSTAEERYANLLQTHPAYVRHIPLRHIASYLGVSPETLSRIRRKIK